MVAASSERSTSGPAAATVAATGSAAGVAYSRATSGSYSTVGTEPGTGAAPPAPAG